MNKPTIATASLEQIQEAFKTARYSAKEAICPLCNTVFTKSRTDQRFCSVQHRQLFWRIKKAIESGKIRKE